MTADPGWYPDPEGPPGSLRYWDGFSWTEHRSAAAVPSGSTSTSPPRRGRRALRTWLAGVLAVLLLLWLVGVVTGEDPQEEPGDASDSQERPTGTGPTDAGAGTPTPTPTPTPSPTPSPSPSPSPSPAGSPTAEPEQSAPRTFVVGRVVDGDTVELSNGRTVRLVGIDTPEVGECGYERAATNLERLVLGRRVRLSVSDEDEDQYGRLLRYVDVGNQDAGLRLIKNGFAIARYDSRDGYGFHPRQRTYVSADRSSRNVRCAPPPSEPRTFTRGDDCAAGYDPCIPPYPPDLDCADVDGPVSVTGTDPHGLDAERDGVGCE